VKEGPVAQPRVRLRLFGHPLHASIVHLPLGLLASVAAWDIASLLLEAPIWWAVSFWSLALGTAATMRPITGTETGRPESLSLVASARAGGVATRPRLPSMTLGSNLALRPPSDGFIESGSLTTSSARARLGRRRMKPRSSSAVIRRWMPDFDARSSASFISSNEGGMPLSFIRSWMNIKSSCCLRVSMAAPRSESEQRLNDSTCSSYVLQ
jgi:hypothetical protein